MTNDIPAKASFTEKEILNQLDLAFQGIPSEFYPAEKEENIKYNFFLDLEHGCFSTAGNRIHLYAERNSYFSTCETAYIIVGKENIIMHLAKLQ
jgi:hypothetical protein